MYSAEYYIEKLDMTPHMEGGYFKECLLGADTLEDYGGSDGKHASRNLWSSIYFLLREGEVSHLHVLRSDEVWYFHDGAPLTIYMITPEGKLEAKKLGLNVDQGELPQIVVPSGCIFGAAREGAGFSLVGCMVAPCFQYDEFQLIARQELLERFPQYADVIVRLAD